MKIDKVTITGADDKITYSDLIDIQEDFPFVEWGILFSEGKEGQKRYPSRQHREKHFIGVLNLSAHFCGWWSRQILEEKNYKLINSLPEQYKRVQLNYNFSKSSGWNLHSLLDFVRDQDRRIIIQYNHSNKRDIDQFIRNYDVPSKFHFLYDASGGRGTEIKEVGGVIGGHYTGHAGGIDYINIDSICSDIGRHPDKSSVWVDLESGARTNDEFDLIKVRQILFKSKYHVDKR